MSITFQSIIEKEEENPGEAEQKIDLVIRIRTFGHAHQVWRIALKLLRTFRVEFGPGITLHLLNGEELVDAEPSALV